MHRRKALGQPPCAETNGANRWFTPFVSVLAFATAVSAR